MTRFDGTDLTGAVFREADLTGARMYGVLLTGADIDGDIRGLRVNGVLVEPLIEAELDRQFPVRTTLRSRSVEGLRAAVDALVAMWEPTLKRAAELSTVDQNRSVNEEWSFLQTLRHLVFVTDAWFGHAVLGSPGGFHPYGLPSFFNGATLGLDASAAPTLAEISAVRAQRWDGVREFLAQADQAEVERVRLPNPAPGWPPPGERTAVQCLHVVFKEEWAHHQFAVRDLDAM